MNEAIEYFTKAKNIAVVGVSDRDFGGAIYKTLKKRGYNVYPVHPTRKIFDGDLCFSTLQGVPPGVQAAVIAVSPVSAMTVVDDARAAGITHLWFQQGRDYAAVIATAEAKGIKTVSRKCILMYARPVTGIHSVHRFLAKMVGRV